MISKLCIWYLKLLEATCRIETPGLELLRKGAMGGFWHEDSLAMNLLLRRAAAGGLEVSVLVTADPRGNAIEKTLKACGGRAIRISYESGALLAAAKGLLRFFKQGEGLLGLAMDGPLGPRRRPKPWPFLLGAKTAGDFIGIRVEYGRELRLKNRWDSYAIPLPFSRIRFVMHDFGPLRDVRPENFDEYGDLIESRLSVNRQSVIPERCERPETRLDANAPGMPGTPRAVRLSGGQGGAGEL